jgi:sec-independent protein translocase protein TatB
MLRAMFGMGGSEIIVILIVALLFLGPDKLPQAAKSLSKGIRDIKKQSRALQDQIESDEQIGGAIRDLKSALRGDELPPRPRVVRPPEAIAPPAIAGGDEAAAIAPLAAGAGDGAAEAVASGDLGDAALAGSTALSAPPRVSLPRTAGEAEPGPDASDRVDHELAAMIKPAAGTVAKGG